MISLVCVCVCFCVNNEKMNVGAKNEETSGRGNFPLTMWQERAAGEHLEFQCLIERLMSRSAVDWDEFWAHLRHIHWQSSWRAFLLENGAALWRFLAFSSLALILLSFTSSDRTHKIKKYLQARNEFAKNRFSLTDHYFCASARKPLYYNIIVLLYYLQKSLGIIFPAHVIVLRLKLSFKSYEKTKLNHNSTNFNSLEIKNMPHLWSKLVSGFSTVGIHILDRKRKLNTFSITTHVTIRACCIGFI